MRRLDSLLLRETLIALVDKNPLLDSHFVDIVCQCEPLSERHSTVAFHLITGFPL